MTKTERRTNRNNEKNWNNNIDQCNDELKFINFIPFTFSHTYQKIEKKKGKKSILVLFTM